MSRRRFELQQYHANDRMSRALEMRVSGMKVAEIAKRLGVSVRIVRDLLDRALEIQESQIKRDVDKLRAIEAERLDRLHAALWPYAMEGDFRAVDRVLKIRESYRKMMGIDLGNDFHVHTGPEITVIDTRPPWERGDNDGGEVVLGEDAATEITPDDNP
jgi:orotate phosphoribosyltransferase-like protein